MEQEHLSQYTPSNDFIEAFGELPYKPGDGLPKGISETFWQMRGRRTDMLQHIRDWDPISIIDVNDMPDVFNIPFYNEFGLRPIFFTSEKRPGIFLSFREVPGMDIWEDYKLGASPARYIIQAQAKMIAYGLKPEKIFPNPGLIDLAKRKGMVE